MTTIRYSTIFIITIHLFLNGSAEPQPLQFAPLVEDWMISEEITLHEASSNDRLGDVEVSSFGNDFAVIWTNNDGQGASIEGLMVTPNAVVRSESKFEIRQRGLFFHSPRLTSQEDVLVIIYVSTKPNTDDRFLRAIRVDKNGEVMDLNGLTLRPNRGFLIPGKDVASNGDYFFIVYDERPIGSRSSDLDDSFSIYGVRMDPNGEILDENPLLLANSAGFDLDVEPGINSGFRVASGAGNDNQFGVHTIIDVSAEGEVLNVSRGWPHGGLVGLPQLAFNGSNHFMAWLDYDVGGNFDTLGTFVPSHLDDSPFDPIPFATGSEDQGLGGLASDGDGFFAVWLDGRNRLPLPNDINRLAIEIFGTRISPQGKVLDPNGLLVATGLSWTIPRLANNGMSYLVTYLDDNGTRGEFLDDTIKAKLIINADRYLMLSDPSLTEDGHLQFQFTAAPGFSFVIEHTTDFESWSELTRFNDFSGEAMVTDDTSGNASRFYRAKRVE